MKPSSGLSAPTPSSSMSVTWRLSSVTEGSDCARSASAAASAPVRRRSLSRPPCGVMSSGTGGHRDQLLCFEVGEDGVQRLILDLVLRVDAHLGVLGRLV